MDELRKINAMDLMKGVVTVVVAVVATIAWMDGHFLTRAEAETLAKAKKVDKLERIIMFQQYTLVESEIDREKQKEHVDADKLKILYMQKVELKKQLGVAPITVQEK